MHHPAIITIFLLLLAWPASCENARCDPEVPSNTTNCKCAVGDYGCTFPSCIDNCVCIGGRCIMKNCIAKCYCPEGGCKMPHCIHDCQNGRNMEDDPPICISHPDLAPQLRGVGWTPLEVCKHHYGDTNNATTPYVCTGTEGTKYACCTRDMDEIKHAGFNLGTCIKNYNIEGIGKGARYRPHNNDFDGDKQDSRLTNFIWLAFCVVSLSLGIFLFLRRYWRILLYKSD